MKTTVEIAPDELAQARLSLLEDICHMVFGEQTKSDLERCISYFTDPESRKDLQDMALVWKEGKILEND